MLPCHLSWGWGGKSLPPICRCDIIFLVEISVVKQFSSKKWRKIPFLLLSAIFVLSFLFSPFRLATLHPRGGTDLERGYGDVPRSWPPFSGQSALPSLPIWIYHHCATLIPPFSNFRKIFNFQPCFGQNFSSQDPNFRSLDPSFFKENPLPRPYIWKPVWHTPTKKKLSAPPRALHMPFFYIHEFCEYKSPQNKAE